ncbi:hypothetical protein IT072_13970 [Leifsonia sp. ZF2019]|uniref:hypothetical protein n=1 Tax=Leifsonia sp. ZF2019 TaxID=2781978 RepID=UPI001CBB1810|nr:hypothetical protein [Leifsonia sp. ZF2019]UAJ78365.1 hypothetical protein IT072_13970 [Leifsonia sp. ZF2019]
MFYGTITTLAGDETLELQSVEIVEDRILLRLRDFASAPGPRGTKQPLAVGTQWTLADHNGTSETLAEQAASGSGPFAGQVDIAFRIGRALAPAEELQLRSADRSIRFSF